MNTKETPVFVGGFAASDGYVNVHSYDKKTGAFVGSHEAHVAKGTGLPAQSTLIAPPDFVPAKIAVFNADSQEWAMVDDLRGSVVYHKETVAPHVIEEIGSLPDHLTTVQPPNPHVDWDGEGWAHNEEKATLTRTREREAEKCALLSEAEAVIQINHWSDKLHLGLLDNEQKLQFIEWLNYMDAIRKLKLNADDYTLPTKPGIPNDD